MDILGLILIITALMVAVYPWLDDERTPYIIGLKISVSGAWILVAVLCIIYLTKIN